MFLETIENLRAVEWARSYSWDVKFPDAPEPFSRWFPASDITQGRWSVETYQFKAHTRSLEIPRAMGLLGMTITFYDGEMGEIEEWMRRWVVVGIFGEGKGVATLGEAKKKLVVQRLDGGRRPVKQWTYDVIPKDTFVFAGGSSSAPKQNAVAFMVVAEQEDF